MLDFFEKHQKENPDFFWFFAVLIIIFILWVLTGGPERSESERNNKFQEPLQPLGSGETYDEPIFNPEGPTVQYPYLNNNP